MSSEIYYSLESYRCLNVNVIVSKFSRPSKYIAEEQMQNTSLPHAMSQIIKIKILIINISIDLFAYLENMLTIWETI